MCGVAVLTQAGAPDLREQESADNSGMRSARRAPEAGRLRTRVLPVACRVSAVKKRTLTKSSRTAWLNLRNVWARPEDFVHNIVAEIETAEAAGIEGAEAIADHLNANHEPKAFGNP